MSPAHFPRTRVLPRNATAVRILESALTTFASRGVGATSLDAVAATAGCTKQTLLHHYGSKDGLLDAVLLAVAGELAEAVDAGLSRPEGEWERLDAVVRAVFRLAARRPELLSLVREVGRLGAPFVDRLSGSLEVLSERATTFLRAGVTRGVFRPHDPRLVLLSAYSSVVAAASFARTTPDSFCCRRTRRWSPQRPRSRRFVSSVSPRASASWCAAVGR